MQGGQHTYIIIKELIKFSPNRFALTAVCLRCVDVFAIPVAKPTKPSELLYSIGRPAFASTNCQPAELIDYMPFRSFPAIVKLSASRTYATPE